MTVRLTMRWIAEAIQGRIAQGDPEAEYRGVSTDSRSIRPGELFWALEGERFKGCDFVGAAAAKGAQGFVVPKGTSLSALDNQVVIAVSDTLWALGEFARHYRRLFDIPIVAITGSNGKTTTKEMIAAMLSVTKQVAKNKGNLNNLIGLPLSLLSLGQEHEAGVFELGMNQRGEIKRLTEICDPTVGVVTNVGPVHLELVGTIEDVAEAKAELFQAMAPSATAVVNSDDPRLLARAQRRAGKKIRFGLENPAEVTARNISEAGTEGMDFDLWINEAALPVHLPMVGTHNVMNALAAAAAVAALGEDPGIIVQGLRHFTNLSLRQQVVRLSGDIAVLNDAYNANPVSTAAALTTFARLKGESRGIVILGDMLELGAQARSLHRTLGRQVAQARPSHLLLLGEYAAEVAAGARDGGLAAEAIVIGKGHDELKVWVRRLLRAGDWVLVKGSRRMAMEKVIEEFLEKGA